jgi:protein tyrosine/serine phosphatase
LTANLADAGSPARPRILDWEGCVNARDEGDLRATGGHIRRAALMRSDMLCGLTAAGSASLIADGVRTIIDIRAADEIADDWQHYPFREHPMVSYLNHPFSAGRDEAMRDQVRAAYGSANSREELNRLDIDLHRRGIAAIVAAIADAPDGGVLVHCHAGKDRTGVIVALTLAVVGVSDDDIADDYALSSLALESLMADWLDYMSDDPRERERLRGLADPRREAMLDTLAYVRDRYSSVEAYLVGAGARTEQLDRLRARLVQPGVAG